MSSQGQGRKQRDQSEFAKKDMRTHIYERPAMYIGSDQPQERSSYIYKKGKMVETTISLAPGLERLFLELLANCSDNVGESRRSKVDPGIIEIELTPTKIILKNSGLAMDTSIHKVEGIPVPQLVFGEFLSGSSFKEERHDAGVNGIGAKAANVMSKYFEVQIDNAYQKVTYNQIWRDNMLVKEEPTTKKYKGKESFVTITYIADFERFGYTEYPEEAIQLFYRHILDISFNSKVAVKINGKLYDYSDMIEYAQLYFGPIGGEVCVYQKKGVELLFMPSSDKDEYKHISFVNCVLTSDGGTHVKEALRAISEPLIKVVSKERPDLESNLTAKDVGMYINLLISVRLMNPSFTSQTKTVLNSKIPTINLEVDISGWSVKQQLIEELEAKDLRRRKKTDGSSRKHVKLLKGIDANDAGTTNRSKTTLIVSEGDSGLAYGSAVCRVTENGKDIFGLLPMKGKCINSFNHTLLKLEKNTEFIEFKKMLGLKLGVDYTIKENLEKLRYGSLLIMTDADVDGKHIAGLILVYIQVNFPSLFKVGYVAQFRTPVLRAMKGQQTVSFYFESEYRRWAESEDRKGWKVDYYKGLASNSDEEVKEDLKENKRVIFVPDGDYAEALRLAFDKNHANLRKDWILNWEKGFALDNLHRSIPKMDGMKESQRKVIFTTLNLPKWKKDPTEKHKVARFVADVASYSSYHHGESNLEDVVVRMAHDWIGSNNLPWFLPKGQLGTYESGGKDAGASRYIYVAPQPALSCVIQNEDLLFIKNRIEEGVEIEPEQYPTIIPMILANGSEGIGSGWSTSIPCHNPRDLIKGVRDRICGNEPQTLLPFYRGYKGKITLEDRKSKRTIHLDTGKVENKIRTEEEMAEDLANQIEDLEDLDEDGIEFLSMERSQYTMVSYGSYEVRNGVVIVTSLPIGVYPTRKSKKKNDDGEGKSSSYLAFLEGLIEKKQLKSVRDLSGGNHVYFELEGLKFNPTYRSLKLIRGKSLGNMIILDRNNIPVRYETADKLMDDFYVQRLEGYEERWNHQKKGKEETLENAVTKHKFISSIVDKSIEIIGRRVEEIYDDFSRIGIEVERAREMLKSVNILALTEKKVKSSEKNVEKVRKELEEHLSTKPTDLWLKDLDELESTLTKYEKGYERTTNAPQPKTTMVNGKRKSGK
jgi:DNA topoisomerase-2